MYKHYVSKVVLKQFADSHQKVSVLDVDTLASSPVSIRRAGGLEDSTLAEPDDTEDVWRTDVENRVHHIIGLLESGQIFSDQTAVDALKNCIVLHFARCLVVHEVLNQQGPKYPTEREQSRYVDRVFLEQYRTGQEKVADLKIEVWRATESEFVIADNPVVLYGGSEDRVGVLRGVTWSDAKAVFMPVSPHFAISLAQDNTMKGADLSAVIKLNRLQVQSALHEIFYSSTGPGEEIAQALRESQATGGRV